MYTVLRATSQTLQSYLSDVLSATEGVLGDRFSDSTMEVSLNTPQEMTSLTSEGLSLWLYRIARDPELNNAPRRRLDVTEWHRSLPLRLHYLATPILAADAENATETEQLILGRVIQAMHDRPVYRGTDLRAELEGQDVELRARLEPTSLEEITRIWDALEGSYQLSVSYEVTVAYVESERLPVVESEILESLAANAGPTGGVGIIVSPGEETSS